MIGRVFKLGERKFVRDTLVLQSATAVQAGTYFATSVLIARYLGDHELGRWATAREIFNFASLILTMGVVQATVSRYCEAVGRQDRAASVRALGALAKVATACSAVVMVLGVAILPSVGESMYEDREVGLIAAVLCGTAIFEAVKSLTVAALQGTRQMVRYAVFDMTCNVLRVGIIGVAIVGKWGIHGIMWAFVAHTMVVAVASLRAYGRARRDGDAKVAPPPLLEVLRAAPSAPVRELFGLSYLIAVNKSLNTLVPRLALLLIPAAAITRDASFGEGGVYSVAYVLAWGLGLLAGSVTQTLLPALGLRLGASDLPFDQMGRTLRKVSLASGMLFGALNAGSLLVMGWVVSTFYGGAYAGAVEYYAWLVLGNVFAGFAVIVDPFYIYSGRMKTALAQNIVYGTLATAMMVLGARHYGPMGGAAMAGLCRIFMLFHLVYIWRYFRAAKDRASTRKATS